MGVLRRLSGGPAETQSSRSLGPRRHAARACRRHRACAFPAVRCANRPRGAARGNRSLSDVAVTAGVGGAESVACSLKSSPRTVGSWRLGGCLSRRSRALDASPRGRAPTNLPRSSRSAPLRCSRSRRARAATMDSAVAKGMPAPASTGAAPVLTRRPAKTRRASPCLTPPLPTAARPTPTRRAAAALARLAAQVRRPHAAGSSSVWTGPAAPADGTASPAAQAEAATPD
jgi:hypothetical protein